MSEVVITKQPTGQDDIPGSAILTTVGVAVSVASKQIPCGRRARLVFVGNAVDPGGTPFVQWSVKVNGTPLADPLVSRFGNANVGQIGVTYDPSQRFTVPKTIPEGCFLELVATLTVSVVDGSSPSANYGVYGYMRVEYEDF